VLAGDRLTLDGDPGGERTTFGNIALYRTSLFRELPRGRKLKMLPLYRDWIARGWASGELFAGAWANIGTASDLAALDAQLRGNAISNGTR
jgi:MurNAc alpha-1-phosphate uridylyltransferase